MPAPELLVVDAMAALDLAVLLRTARTDVAVAHTGTLDGQEEGERELGTVVGLNLANGKWKGPDDLREETETREHVEPRIEPQDPETGAIVTGRVLVGFATRHPDDLDVNLDRLSGCRLLEQLQLPRPAPPFCAVCAGQSQLIGDPGDRLGRHLYLVNAHQPQAGAAGAPPKLSSSVGDQLHHLGRDPALPPLRVPR